MNNDITNVQFNIKPYIPTLYKYLKTDYIDDFLNSGHIKLSSFFKCRSHENKARLDVNEGECALLGNSPTVKIAYGMGNNSLIFCTSLLADKKLCKAFDVNDYLVIDNPIEFIKCITDKIQEQYRVKDILYGPCCYQSTRNVSRDISQEDMDAVHKEKKPEKIIVALSNLKKKMENPDLYFLKLNKYKYQQEYRFVWICQAAFPDDIDLYVPKAIEFCRRIKNKK